VRTLKWITLFVSLFFFSLTIQAQGQSGRVDITGEASIEIADFFEEGRSELYYFIVDKQSRARTQVFFPGLPDAAFQSGAKVLIRGKSRGKGKGVDVESLEMIEPAPARPGAAAAVDGTTAEAPVASSQTRKVLTLMIDFQDAVVDTGTGNAVDASVLSAQMFNDSQNIQHFYNTASLGTLTIPIDPNNIGKEPIFGPYSIAYNYLTTSAGGATCDANGWANAALNAWEADTGAGGQNTAGEDRYDYDSWSLIVPNYYDYSNRACGWGGYAGVGCTQCWAFSADPASILFGVIIHELGHNFGFGHANSDTDNDGLNICGYCDGSDQMGSDREWMKFNAPHFDFQGWWDPVSYDIDTITPSSMQQEFDLIPVDEEDTIWPGLRAVKTQRTTGSNYYFSYRQRTGHYDAVNVPYTTGVNIHWGSSSLSNGYTTNFYRMLDEGQVFVDSGQNLVVWGVGAMPVDNGLGNVTNVFTIRVCNSTCTSLWPPLNMGASGTNPTTITLTWDDYTYNEDGWNVEYSTDGASWSSLGTASPNATSYSHTGLSDGMTLYYRARAYRGGSEFSEWSEIVSATTPPGTGTYLFPIVSGDDDTLEYTGPYTGQMYPSWSYQWLGYDSENEATSDEGLRFQNITIPQGATINSASIRYYAYSGSGDTTIRFRAESVDDAVPFTTAPANLTSRTFGSAYVDWTLPTSWSGGSQHTSPDLTSILQPIVDRSGWGGGNAIVFITQGQPDYPSGSHRVLTFDYTGNTYGAALSVDYTWTPPGSVAPAASFNHSTYSLEVTFADTSTDSDGNVVSWLWDFGDSGSSTLQNPVHTYGDDGTFTVTLTVTDDDGHSGQTSQWVTLLAAPDGLTATPTAIDSIDLNWNDNSNVENGYLVERSPGGAGTWAQIGSVGASVNDFTDNTDLSDASIYDYRVKATGPDFDSSYSSTTSVTAFVCSSSKTFTGKEWYQFALACDPGPYNTVAHIFDGPQPLVYGFDAASNSYARLMSADTLVPGVGYWVNFIHTTAYTLSGYDNVNADIPLVTDSLSGRNNLVGFPGNGTVAWPDVLVVDGSQTKTLLEADPWENGSNPTNRVCDLPTPTSKCLMSRKLNIWGGSKAAGSYQVHDPDVPGQEGTLVPLDGLWIKAFKSGVKLRIPAPSAPAPSAPAPEAVLMPVSSLAVAVDSKVKLSKSKGKGKGKGKGKKDKNVTWYVRLVAESGDLRDPGNTLGQKAGSIEGQDARDLEEPAPFSGDHLSILFTNPLFGTSSWGFTTDFRATANSPAGEWPFIVRASVSSAPITLSWEANAFDFTGAWLVDQQTGERISVTNGGSYTFQPVGAESSFVFIIE
jgi:PKD repeat protein